MILPFDACYLTGLTFLFFGIFAIKLFYPTISPIDPEISMQNIIVV
jgi:hypothetical protein